MGGMQGGDGKEVQEGGDVCIYMADSLHCTAETNTTFQSNYSPIKRKRNKLRERKQREVWGKRGCVTYKMIREVAQIRDPWAKATMTRGRPCKHPKGTLRKSLAWEPLWSLQRPGGWGGWEGMSGWCMGGQKIGYQRNGHGQWAWSMGIIEWGLLGYWGIGDLIPSMSRNHFEQDATGSPLSFKRLLCGRQSEAQKEMLYSLGTRVKTFLTALLSCDWHTKTIYLMYTIWWVWTHANTCKTITRTYSMTSKSFLLLW